MKICIFFLIFDFKIAQKFVFAQFSKSWKVIFEGNLTRTWPCFDVWYFLVIDDFHYSLPSKKGLKIWNVALGHIFFPVSPHTRAQLHVLRSWYCIQRVFRCFWTRFKQNWVSKWFLQYLSGKKWEWFGEKTQNTNQETEFLRFFAQQLYFHASQRL